MPVARTVWVTIFVLMPTALRPLQETPRQQEHQRPPDDAREERDEYAAKAAGEIDAQDDGHRQHPCSRVHAIRVTHDRLVTSADGS